MIYIYISIYVTKDKHDWFTMNSDREILIEIMTIQNNSDRFHSLLNLIFQSSECFENIKVVLKSTDHYINSTLNLVK